jgi:hypothetical protein
MSGPETPKSLALADRKMPELLAVKAERKRAEAATEIPRQKAEGMLIPVTISGTTMIAVAGVSSGLLHHVQTMAAKLRGRIQRQHPDRTMLGTFRAQTACRRRLRERRTIVAGSAFRRTTMTVPLNRVMCRQTGMIVLIPMAPAEASLRWNCIGQL